MSITCSATFYFVHHSHWDTVGEKCPINLPELMCFKLVLLISATK